MIFQATSIGMQTLLGVRDQERPSSSGNCFSVFVGDVTTEDIINRRAEEYKIVNFNLENLKDLLRQGLTWPIQCKILDGRVAILHDPRIGERWYQIRYCEVCCPESLLPITQVQIHEREEMTGQREKLQNCIKYDFSIKRQFP